MMGAFSHASSWNDWFDALPKTSPLCLGTVPYVAWYSALEPELAGRFGSSGHLDFGDTFGWLDLSDLVGRNVPA